AGQPNPYGIDLDHHLIPDPVGKAIACLLERLDSLEKQVEAGGLLAAGSQQQYYQGCDPDNSICESDCAGGAVVRVDPFKFPTAATAETRP
ncbi:MAG: hypothetical protein NDI70_11515, partial [Pseudomonas sagittaria]|nr:hypothetical protein [Pseudomonas sagittaria]